MENDLISKQATKEWLAKWYGYIDMDIIARMQFAVDDIPTVHIQQGSDCISRQAAIDRINGTGYADQIKENMVFIMMQLPSAQPEQRWIPCSERLPDIKEHHVSEPCIVYCENGAYGFAALEENIFGQVGWNCERDDEYHEPLGEVLAWMPLPEPYAERITDDC